MNTSTCSACYCGLLYQVARYGSEGPLSLQGRALLDEMPNLIEGTAHYFKKDASSIIPT